MRKYKRVGIYQKEPVRFPAFILKGNIKTRKKEGILNLFNPEYRTVSYSRDTSNTGD